MKEHNPLSRHPRIVPLGILALILGPAILYVVLRSTGVPAALVSGVVLLVAAKHLGLLAMIVAPFYALVRRRASTRSPATVIRSTAVRPISRNGKWGMKTRVDEQINAYGVQNGRRGDV